MTIFANYIRHLRQSLRYFCLIILAGLSLATNLDVQESSAYFNRIVNLQPFLDGIVQPFEKPKTLVLTSSDNRWNNHFLNPVKKITKISRGFDRGTEDNIIVFYYRYLDFNILIENIMTIDTYIEISIDFTQKDEFRKKMYKSIKLKKQNQSGSGKGVSLIKTQVGDTELELSLGGNINIDGRLIHENKDLVMMNLRDNESWDLDIEQKQKFNIEGTIGEKWFINVDQDSEADFSWENDLSIEYKGDKNDIFKRAQGGNINLSLPSTQFVSVGSGSSEGLFGLKFINQLGPVELQTIISKEQVTRSAKTFEGGESSEMIDINEYSFIKDRYFFIDNQFKLGYYPLTPQSAHVINPEHVIGGYELYKRVYTMEVGVVPGVAYLDPQNQQQSYKVDGNWKRLEEGIDYEIDRLLGWVRLNNISSNEAVGIAYTYAIYDPSSQEFFEQGIDNGTDLVYLYDFCIDEDYVEGDAECVDWTEGNGEEGFQPPADIRLKLIKDTMSSTPNSKTWPLMFKNVYSLSASNISADGLEISIVRDLGAGEERTHTDSGVSYLNLFGLDSKDQNNQSVDGGDGSVDLYSSFLNLKYGELFIPSHLPFSYDNNPRIFEQGNGDIDTVLFNGAYTYWGTNEQELEEIIEYNLNDPNGDFECESGQCGPSMYFSTIQDQIIDEHEFLIKVTHSSKSSTVNLGFMIREGSESVRLNGNVMQKDKDYSIDYFSGTLNFINEQFMDPTADINISYEENELISFDQKLLIGTHFKYDLNNNNFLSGGLYYYNQSLVEQKVDIGYEPMRNLIWNINGKYQKDIDFLTRAIDMLPLIETTKPSRFSLEGEYAQVFPNPNPLDEAFIDDFESSKRTTSLNMLFRQWKLSSAPEDSVNTTLNNKNRGDMFWYNPEADTYVTDIWPNKSTSIRPDQNTIKTLWIETNFKSSMDNQKVWNGITVPLFTSDYDQSQSKYLDIWLNANDVDDELLRLHIDIGLINEDADSDGKLDTEDEDVYGGGLGDGYLSDAEDIGIDHCTDSYEDGWGGCLCESYSNEIYSVESLDEIYNYSVGDSLYEYCLEGTTYEEEYYNNSLLINSNIWIDPDDPNGDNWSWISGSSDFSMVNGTEGNGQTIRYPDTEDLDSNFSLDEINDYFSVVINPLEDADDGQSMVLTETENNGIPTGWKLFRIPLAQFSKLGESVDWSEVRSARLWFDSELDTGESSKNLIKIAKIEIVSNEWKELGVTDIENFPLIDDSEFTSDSLLTIEVLNTDENPEYTMPDGVIVEYDEYNEMYLKEQSLAIAFKDPNNTDYGISPKSIVAIKKSFSSLPSDKRNSFFAYKYMKMFTYGGDPSNFADWPADGSMQLLFRIGKDDEYYEIKQPIYPKWDPRNEIKINLDLLSSKKLEIHPLESFNDFGLDDVEDSSENGCYGSLPNGYSYQNIIAENSLSNFAEVAINDSVTVCGQLYWDVACSTCTNEDPNGDNWLDCGLDNICYTNEEDYDEGEGNEIFDEGEHGTEGNGIFDNNNGAGESFNDVWEDGTDGVFDSPDSVSEYNDTTGVWSWDSDSHAISEICSNCSELRIKGEPAINKIEYIIVGVANDKDNETISGKVLLDELRLTQVKKEKGQAFRIKSSISLGDVLDISASYSDEEADFHRLQERLGAGSSDRTLSLNATLNSNKILPENWKVKIPVKLSYNSTNSTPKFMPGSDILSGGPDLAPDSIKSINNKVSFSTSFKKTSKSDNWFILRTIDNLSLNLSAIQSQRSSSTIANEDILDINGETNYGYTFDKENYFRPLKFMKNIPLFGKFFNDARLYYSPQKIGAKMEIAQYEKTSLQRQSGAETSTYSYTMKRSFNINHKFSKSLQSNYTKNINSNLDQFKDSPFDFIENMSPGQVQRVDEKLINTFSPDFLKWLSPSIKFNPSYSWDLVQVDTTKLANIGTNNSFKAGIILKPKDLVEVFYKPTSSSSSSRRRRSRTSSSSSSGPLLKIENENLKKVFDFIHKNTARVSKISLSYDITSSNSYNNIDYDISPDYIFRFGLSDSPSNLTYADESTGQIGSSSNTYKTDIKINTNINLAKNIIMSLDYKSSKTDQAQSTGIPTSNTSTNYFPIGVRGNEGFQVPNWNLTWSGVEKLFWFSKYFKTISFNHSYNGQSSSSFKNNEPDPQTWDYSQAFSPLIGMNLKTKGKNPLMYKINLSRNLNIKNSGTSIERSYSNKINSTLSFSKKGGINIPLFFRDDLYLPNDISFNVDFSFDDSYTLISSVVVSDISQLNEQTKNLNWSCKPNINYSFSKWVSGNFYFIYGVSNNKTTGRSEETDFGFSVNIRIQG